MIANMLTRKATIYKVVKIDDIVIQNVDEVLEEVKEIKVQVYSEISRNIRTNEEYYEEGITLITNEIKIELNQIFEFEGVKYKVINKKKCKPYMSSKINVGTIFKGVKYG